MILWQNKIISLSKSVFTKKKVTYIIIFIIRIFPNFDFVIIYFFIILPFYIICSNIANLTNVISVPPVTEMTFVRLAVLEQII